MGYQTDIGDMVLEQSEKPVKIYSSVISRWGRSVGVMVTYTVFSVRCKFKSCTDRRLSSNATVRTDENYWRM